MANVSWNPGKNWKTLLEVKRHPSQSQMVQIFVSSDIYRKPEQNNHRILHLLQKQQELPDIQLL